MTSISRGQNQKRRRKEENKMRKKETSQIWWISRRLQTNTGGVR